MTCVEERLYEEEKLAAPKDLRLDPQNVRFRQITKPMKEKADKKLYSITTKFVEKDSTSCPNCEKIASGNDEIIRDFGLRNMGDGTIIVQSWCRKCRKRSMKGVVA